MKHTDITRKTSRKRTAIINAMRFTSEHPSAEAVYDKIRNAFPQISLGTIYRNLTILREEGLIKSVAVVGGQERYDADMSRHTHFICECCNAVIDLDAGEDFAQTERLARSRGFSVSRHELIVYGSCHVCSEQAAYASSL